MKNFRQLRLVTVLSRYRTVIFIVAMLLIAGASVGLFFALRTAQGVAAAQEDWQNTTWQYRKEIVLDDAEVTGAGSLTDFPLLISVTDTHVGSNAQADGDDIFFTSSDKITKLNHSIVSYNSGTGALTSWVKIPSLAGTADTSIYMYYGNASASNQEATCTQTDGSDCVWDGNYKLVMHLEEDPAVAGVDGIIDETANNNHGTDNGGMDNNDTVTGKVGQALDFDDTNDYIDAGTDSSLDVGSGDYTISAWFQSSSTDTEDRIIGKGSSWGGGYRYSMSLFGDCTVGELHASSDDNSNIDFTCSTSTVNSGNWVHGVQVRDGNTLRLYVNGVAQTPQAMSGTGSLDSPRIFAIGSLYSENVSAMDDFFDGTIDEPRMSNTARSADWIATEYDNQNDPTLIVQSVGDWETPNAIVSWRFNSASGTTAYDSTNQANHGTISGATWQNEDFCVQGSCLLFDGTDDLVSKTYSSDTELDPGTADITIAGWFRHNAEITGTDTLLSRYNGAGYKLYMNSSGNMCFGIDDDATWDPDDEACTTATYNDSTWYYFEATRTSSAIELWIDGSKVAEDTSLASTGSLSGTSPTLYLGIDSDGTSNPWGGFIDELAIFREDRSSTSFLTSNDKPPAPAGIGPGFVAGTTTETLTSGLIGYWQMDQSSGDATDSSGNGKTLENNALATYAGGKFGAAADFESTSSQFLDEYNYVAGSTPAFRAATVDGDNDGTSSTMNKPAGTVEDDILYALFSLEQPGTSVITPPTGFSLLDEIEVDTDHTVRTYWKRAGASEPASYTFNFSGNYFYSAFLVAYSGALTSGSPFDTAYSENTGSGGTITHTSITTNYNNSMIIVPGAQWEWDLATNFHGRTSRVNAQGVFLSDEVQATAGATGSKTTTHDGLDTWVAYLRAIRGTETSGSDDVSKLAVIGDLTVAGWINPESTTAATQFNIAGKWDSGDEAYMLAQYGDEIRMYINSPSVYATTDASSLSTGTWYHVAGVYNASQQEITIYIDGQQQAATITGTVPSSISNTTGIFHVGAEDSGGTAENFYDGKIDEVRVYNRALAPAEVQALFEWTPGPVGYWRFDEESGTTVYDRSANSNDGTIQGGGTRSDDAILGNSLSIAGDDNDQYLSVADDPALDMSGGDQMTLMAWVNKTADSPGSGDYEGIAGKLEWTSGDYREYSLLNLDSGGDNFSFSVSSDGTDTNETIVNSNYTFSNDTWYHVAGVADGSQIHIYVNGDLKNSTAHTTGIFNSANAPFEIGRLDDNSGSQEQYWYGLIDEVKLYNFAFTEDEIAAEYQRHASSLLGTSPTPSPAAALPGNNLSIGGTSSEYCPPGDTCTDPVGHWKLDEGSWDGTAGEVIDYGTLGNDGVSEGTAEVRNGIIGNAGYFASAGDGVTISDNDAYSISNELTVMAWVRPDTIDTVHYVVAKGDPGDYEWQIQINSDGALRGHINNSSGTSFLSSPWNADVLTVGNWYHLAMVVDLISPYLTMYKNGALHTEDTTGSGTYTNGTAFLDIGQRDSGAGFEGLIDDVRIYDYARSPAQIAWDYNKGEPVAHWKFDESSTTTVYDASINAEGETNGNTGTLQNDATHTSDGVIKSAVSFDGTGDGIDLSSSSIIGDSDTFSIAAWVKTSDTTGAIYGEFTANGDNARNYFGISSSGSLSFIQETPSGSDLVTTQTVNSDTWTHVAYVQDGTTRTLYINGAQEVTDTSAETYTGASPTAGRIGYRGSNHAADDLNGSLDDIRIFSYPLTEEQIAQIMNDGSSLRFGE